MSKDYKRNLKWGSAVATISLAITLFKDYTNEEPWFSTVTSAVIWIFNKFILILNYEFKVWHILIFLLILLIIFVVVKIFTDKSNDPEFLTYTSDNIKNLSWKWTWSFGNNGWEIETVMAHCPECDTPLVANGISYTNDSWLECPRCDFKTDTNYYEDNHYRNIKLLITDNAKKMGESTDRNK